MAVDAKAAAHDPRQLFFLHIPKTAGTSIIHFLTEAAGDAPVHFEGRHQPPIDDIPARDLREYRVLGGHIPFHFAHWGLTHRRHTLPRLGRALWRPARVYLAVLRDPAETVISHHRYVQRHGAHGWATRGSLADAFRDREKFVGKMRDLQCYYLSGRRRARAALRTVERVPSIVGTVERLDLVTEALNAFFGTDIAMTRVNVAPKKFDRSGYDAVSDKIAAITREDQTLYDTIRRQGIHLNL